MSEQYGEEDHRKVWDTYRDLRNWVKTAKVLGMSMDTIRRWKDADFKCKDGCPYHNYDGLFEELKQLRQGRNKLIAEGNYSPVTSAEAAIQQLSGAEAARKMDISKIADHPSYEIFRKDEERASHLELLWERCVYQMTGMPLVSDKELAEKGLTRDDYHNLHQGTGLQLRNMKDGISSLQAIMGMIETLKGGKASPAQEAKATTSKLDELNIAELIRLSGNPQILIDATDAKVK